MGSTLLFSFGTKDAADKTAKIPQSSRLSCLFMKAFLFRPHSSRAVYMHLFESLWS